MDKRTGKKTINQRAPIADVGLPSYTLDEVVDFWLRVKRGKNLKERRIEQINKTRKSIYGED
ncbi:hypothetical protein [Paenibacillus lentus]|uniref:Uncharacterized protein n=1 Tax=Paenibacillus lentus TaxID=1338368 RepID=A0A3Q8S3Y3_9BACL|nr:hypothetical protein [Paenibacillus lentus]AZK45597.1 hypothetical protein EIM92_04780 [Paenibacillus lentus]